MESVDITTQNIDRIGELFPNCITEALDEERSTPKPVKLIELLLEATTYDDKEAIIMDFFSGSATTAHATMSLNAKDGGKRKFIMVQYPEKYADSAEAYKRGFKTISDTGKERIRLAAKKIREESGFTANDLDLGFRVFKIDESNMNDV